jgi:topoisomerase-4 subunit A
MLGTEGIAVGMSTRILPHNFGELLDAQIALLNNEVKPVFPDFLQGGIMDVSDYDEGRGKVRVRARIEKRGDKTIAITEIPAGTTTEGLIASIEAAIQKGKVKIGGINDFTTEQPEIELSLPRGVYADEVIPQLYAWTDCEVSISSNIVVIKDRHPKVVSVTDVLHAACIDLRNQIKAELELELSELEDKQHWLTLEQIFIENRVYKRIEEATTAQAVNDEVVTGMEPFQELFIRELTDDDVERLLKIQIRRISAYDIEKNRKDIDDIVRAIKKVRKKLKNLTKTTIAWLEDIRDRFAGDWPRRTEIDTFQLVDKKSVARSSLKLSYDPETGFLVTGVKPGPKTKWSFTVSEFDKILSISQDGTFRVVSPSEKFLVPGKVLWMGVMPEAGGLDFTVLYRDKQKNAFAKKISIERYTRGREYELIKGKAGKIDHLIEGHASNRVHLDFVPAARQRVSEADFELADLEVTGIAARGARMAPKPISKVKVLKG